MGRHMRNRVFRTVLSTRLEDLKQLLDKKPKRCLKNIFRSTNSKRKKTPLIAASLGGLVDIMVYLIEECNVDVDQVGIVYFDRMRISNVTPLWCGAAIGNLDVVKILISHKASLNIATNIFSTPLFVACYYRHFEIAKYLIENGADVNAINSSGSTCLMMACFQEYIDIVIYLLEHEADVNRKNFEGSTALHEAASLGNCDLITILLDHGAKMQCNYFGISPILEAAAKSQVHAVEYIIINAPSTFSEKIDAYKLLGATLIDEHDHMILALKCWKMAVAMLKLEAKSSICVLENVPPVAAYHNAIEIHSEKHLETIISNPEDMWIQALLIRERILGPRHYLTTRYIFRRALRYSELGNFDCSAELLLHMLHLQQSFLNPLHYQIMRNIEYVMEHLYFMMIHSSSDDKHMPYTLRHALTFLNQITELIKDAMLDSTKNEMHFCQLLCYTVHIFNIFCMLLPEIYAEEKVMQCIINLVRLNPRANDGWTFLHIASSESSVIVVCNSIFFLEPSKVIELLLKIGLSPNDKDLVGDTPLHVVVSNSELNKYVFNMFLDNGAHLDIPNEDGTTALDVLKSVHGVDIFPLRYMSLKCVCAKVIHENNISFHGEIPKNMEEFLNFH